MRLGGRRLLPAVPLNRFLQKLSVAITDFHKTKTHSRQRISVRSAVEVGPEELAHDFDFFYTRFDQQSIGFIQLQPFRAMNEHSLNSNIPCFPLYRPLLRYHRHRPPDLYARESSFLHEVAQSLLPPGLMRIALSLLVEFVT